MTNDEIILKQPGMNTAGKVLAIIGAVCQLGPFVGVLGTIQGIMRAFEGMGTHGHTDPGTLSAPIGEALVSTALGILASMLGMVLLLIGITLCNYRPKWARVLLIIVGTVWFLALLGLGSQQLLRYNRGQSSQPRSSAFMGSTRGPRVVFGGPPKTPSLGGVPAALHRLAPLPFRRAAETYMRAACAPHEP